MKNEMKDDAIVIKKDTLVSWLLSSVLILALIFMGSLFVKSLQYEDNYNQLSSVASGSFSDTNLNVIINYPNEWLLSDIDNTHVVEVVKESAKDEIFNMGKHSLTQEVVSCMLVGDQTRTGGFGKFMSVSFRGDKGLKGEELKKEVEERLKLEIKSTGSTGIEITHSNLEGERVVYLEAKTVLEGTPIYYSQYTTLVGKNIVTVLKGSTSSGFNSYDELKDLVDKIIIVEGTGIPSSSTQQPVTTDVINPKGFQITR